LRRQGLNVPAFAISCGVDLKRFYPDVKVDPEVWRAHFGLDTSRVVFLYVGRVDGEKRLDVLLHALRRLERDDIQLAIAGRGAARNSLETLAAELGLGEKVRFLGFVPDETLPALLNSVDVFAMPSEAELLSIASLEAMACGRPLLAARAQALPELVTDGGNGFLFRPGDPLDAAQSMARMADFRERLTEMGLASLQKVQIHNRKTVLQRYEEMYKAVIGKEVRTARSSQMSECRVRS
jgi:glycosyltransferase involved in cell wall biosynthesis